MSIANKVNNIGNIPIIMRNTERYIIASFKILYNFSSKRCISYILIDNHGEIYLFRIEPINIYNMFLDTNMESVTHEGTNPRLREIHIQPRHYELNKLNEDKINDILQLSNSLVNIWTEIDDLKKVKLPPKQQCAKTAQYNQQINKIINELMSKPILFFENIIKEIKHIIL